MVPVRTGRWHLGGGCGPGCDGGNCRAHAQGGAIMRALIVYESLYGNTHIIANSIAEGLRDKACDVEVVPVTRAAAEMARDTDLLIVGGPTHMHGMTSGSSRRM